MEERRLRYAQSWKCDSIPGTDSSLFLNGQVGSWTHPASYSEDTGTLCPEVKRLQRDADHSPLPHVYFKKKWSYVSVPPYVLMTFTETTLVFTIHVFMSAYAHRTLTGVKTKHFLKQLQFSSSSSVFFSLPLQILELYF